VSDITKAIDYVIDLKLRAVDVWVEETIEPLLKEAKKLEDRIFEKEYKKQLDLEKSLKEEV